MASILTKAKPVPNITLDMKSPEELNLVYEVLDPTNQELMLDTADCLADTFAGTDIGGRKIYEPMANAVDLTKDAMFEFILEYLTGVANDGLCFIAKDKESNRVVGAVASDNFDPNEEVPKLEGHLSGMNDIYDFLIEIDEKLIESIEKKTGNKVEKNQFVHMLLAGSRLGKFKSYVVAKLVEMIVKVSSEKGYLGVFAEATSDRSSKVLTEYHGFTLVDDVEGNPIIKNYSSHDAFKCITEDVAPGCRIIYKAIDKRYEM